MQGVSSAAKQQGLLSIAFAASMEKKKHEGYF
jgi:hypothetical protein